VPRTFLAEGRRLVLRVFGVLGTRAIIVVCLLASASVAIGAWRNLWMTARGTAVDGTVVQQAELLSADFAKGASDHAAGPELVTAKRMYQAVVEFKVGDKAYRIRSQRLAPVHVYPLASSQVVVFYPDHPHDARLRAELPDIWSQAALLLMGSLIGAGTLRWWWWLARRVTSP
jgi:hypothetical protein